MNSLNVAVMNTLGGEVKTVQSELHQVLAVIKSHLGTIFLSILSGEPVTHVKGLNDIVSGCFYSGCYVCLRVSGVGATHRAKCFMAELLVICILAHNLKRSLLSFNLRVFTIFVNSANHADGNTYNEDKRNSGDNYLSIHFFYFLLELLED
uniref:Uncharacterized protein n=1 Tax=Medicago truncatula TaxID=3880 RepID=I3SNF6_MEDTR|nr:unknown [Medicago truncatula]